MTEFFVFAAILVAASLVFVLVPLWRAAAPTPDKRREANIAVYHQRYAEIEREVVAGRITRGDAELEKDELGARLLVDIDETPALTDGARSVGRPWLISLLMIVLLVGGAAAAYWDLGDYQAMQSRDRPDIATMLDRLQQQVNASPDDLEARAMLARTQEMIGDHAGAARNYRAINAALPEPQAPVVAAEGEATLQATDDLQGRARELFRQLLDLDANSREALWYLGLGAAERGDNAQAVVYWDRLLEQKLPEDLAAMVRGRRNELAGGKPELKSG